MLVNSCEEIFVSKAFLILLLLEGIVVLALFTINTTCLIKVILDQMLSSKTRILLPSILLVPWFRSARLVHNRWFGSELFDWYRDTTFVPYCHFQNDWSPQVDDCQRYCTKTGSIYSKFFIPDQMNHFVVLDDEHKNFFYSSSVPIIFPQMQKSFSSILPKWVFQVPLRRHSKSSQGKPANHKMTSRDKL